MHKLYNKLKLWLILVLPIFIIFKTNAQFSTNKWQHVIGEGYNPQVSVYGVKNEPSKNAQLGIRKKALSWSYNNHLYIFGGQGLSNNYKNDIWKYSLATKQWSWIKGSHFENWIPGGYNVIDQEDSTNTPISSQGSIWSDSTMVYFYDGGSIWRYNNLTNNWSCLIDKGNNKDVKYGQINVPDSICNPGFRAGAVTWVFNNELYLFGGYNTNYNFNDVWKFNLATKKWTWIKGHNVYVGNGAQEIWGPLQLESPNVLPFGSAFIKNYHSKIQLGNYIYIFLGHSDQVWRYNNLTNNWRIEFGTPGSSLFTWMWHSSSIPPKYGTIGQYAITNTPGVRGGSFAWEHNGEIFLSRGTYDDRNNSSFNHIYYSDLWQFDTTLFQWRCLTNDTSINLKALYGTKYIETATNKAAAQVANNYWKLGDKLYILNGFGYGSFFPNVPSSNFYHFADLFQFNLNNKRWTWLDGHNNHDYLGMFDALNSENYYNSPPNVQCNAYWNADSVIYYSMFSDNSYGYACNSLNIWKYNVKNNSWSIIKINSPYDSAINSEIRYGTINQFDTFNSPGLREGAITWYYNNSLYLFGGGLTASNILSDIWQFDLNIKQWRCIKGNNLINNIATYGTMGVPNANNNPGARLNASPFIYNNKLFFYGGEGIDKNNKYGLLNEMWSFNLQTNEWTFENGDIVVNEPSVFGTLLQPSITSKPGSRTNVAVVVKDHDLFLFGGMGVVPPYNDIDNIAEVWSYNFNTKNWTWLKGNLGVNYFFEQNENRGTQHVESSTVRPKAGNFTNSAFVLDNNTILITTKAVYSLKVNIWTYNTSTNSYTYQYGLPTLPYPGAYPDTVLSEHKNFLPNDPHSQWVFNNKLYIAEKSNFNIWSYEIFPDTSILNFNLGNDTSLCEGNYLQLNVGTIANKYEWSNGDSVNYTTITKPGKYWLKATKQNQIFSDTINIYFDTPPKVPFLGEETICLGDSFILNAENPGYLYEWNNGDTSQILIAKTSGNYFVKIKNANNGGGCFVTANKKILVNGPYYDSINKNINNLRVDFALVNPIDIDSTIWDFGGGIKEKGFSVSHQFDSNFIYPIILTNFNKFCGEYIDTLWVDLSKNNINTNNFNNEIQVFPNPAYNKLNIISSNLPIQSIKIFNVIGVCVFHQENNIATNNMEIDISLINSGYYNLSIETKAKNYYKPVVIN